MIATMFERLKEGDYFLVTSFDHTTLPLWKKTAADTGTLYEGKEIKGVLCLRAQEETCTLPPHQSVLRVKMGK